MDTNKPVMQDILVMDPGDNVGVCLKHIAVGAEVSVEACDGKLRLRVREPVPQGHKICLRKIDKNEPVIKYGEIIGKASVPIQMGQHVHVHNVVDN